MKQKRNLIVSLMLIAVLVVVSGVMAACGAKVYTVTFDSNGGSQVEICKVEEGKLATEPAAPTRVGYTFAGWAKEDGSLFDFGTEKVKSNITLRAQWNINSYAVRFETNGGTAVAGQTIEHGSVVAEPYSPTKEGYVFVGWYADQNLVNRYDFTKGVMADTTIYARFVKDIAEVFTVSFVGSENPIPDQQTVGGIVLNLPAASQPGKEFLGWWMSDFDDATKLTCQYTDQVLGQHTILYAVFKGEGVAVSVKDNKIEWESAGVGRSYSIKITPPSGTPIETTVTSLEYAFDFSALAAGTYMIEVTVAGKTTTVYYSNKALDRVSLFDVEDYVLKFNKVAGATKYIINIECGDPEHQHSAYDNGGENTYNFQHCVMTHEGIKFTVTAQADGKIASVSETFVLIRNLPAVTGIRVNEEELVFEWDAVEGADSYLVQIGDEEPVVVTGTTSKSIRNYPIGEVEIRVVAQKHGYNSAEATEYVYNKVKLPAPQNVTVDSILVSWDEVAGAEGYIVKIGELFETEVDGAEFEIPEAFRLIEIEIQIMAVGSQKEYNSLFSDKVGVSPTLKGKLSYSVNMVRWSAVPNATAYQVKVNDGEIEDATGMAHEIEFTQKGENEVSVRFYKDGEWSEWETITVVVYEIRLMTNYAESDESYTSIYRAHGDNLNLGELQESAGYNFGFWSAERGGIPYVETTLVAAGDLTLFATWEPKKFNVYFDAGEGSIDVEYAEVGYNTRYVLPVPTPVDETYSFVGWANPENPTTIYTNHLGESRMVYQNLFDTTYVAVYARVFELIAMGDEWGLTKGEGMNYIEEITIPVEYQGKKITSIEANAFRDTPIRVINIPSTIRLIEMGTGGPYTGSAFYGAEKVTDVNIYDVPGVREVLYKSVDGVLFYNNPYTGVEMLYFPFGRPMDYEYHVPYGTQILTGYMTAIFGNRLSKIYIPATVTRLMFKSLAANFTDIIFEDVPENPVDEIGWLTEEQMEDVPNWKLTVDYLCFNNIRRMEVLNLPSRLESFDMGAIAGTCQSLKRINVLGTGGNYTSKDGFLCNATGDELILAAWNRTGSVRIPAGIKKIGPKAFYRCEKLTDVIIPSYVEEIGESAFELCDALQTVVFEYSEDFSTTLSIGNRAFYDIGSKSLRPIQEVVIPESCTYIGSYAFAANPTLKTVTLNCPNATYGESPFVTSDGVASVETVNIGPVGKLADLGAMFGNTIQVVTVDPANTSYVAVDNVIYNYDKTQLLFYPVGKVGDYVLPETVTEIPTAAFLNRIALTGITIHGGVTSIGSEAFKGCIELRTVTFLPGDANLTIGSYAFDGCNKVTNFNIPDRTSSIGAYAFANTIITEFTIPANVKTLNNGLFAGNTVIHTINIHKDVNSISALTFDNVPALTNVKIDSANPTYQYMDGVVYRLVNGAPTTLLFNLPGNKGVDGKLVVPSTVTRIESNAFAYAQGLTEIDARGIASNAVYGLNAFTNMQSVKIIRLGGNLANTTNNSSKTSRLIYNNPELEEIHFPNNIKYFYYNTVSECPKLHTVTFAPGGTGNFIFGSRARSNQLPFTNCPSLKAIELPANTYAIMPYAFYGYSGYTTTQIEYVTFAEGANNLFGIGNDAFTYSHIKAFEFPGSHTDAKEGTVTYIGDSCFQSCYYLEEVTFSENAVVKFDKKLDFGYQNANLNPTVAAQKNGIVEGFNGDRSLKRFDVPAHWTFIPQTCFMNCTALEEFNIPEDSQLTEIKLKSLANTPIKEIFIPGSVTKIYEGAFEDCTQLKKVTFGENSQLKEIVKQAFKNTGLTSFTFPESSSAIKLGHEIFAMCKDLKEIYVSSSIQEGLNRALEGVMLEKLIISEDNEYYIQSDPNKNWLWDSTGTILQIVYLKSNETEVHIPEGTTIIGAGAFAGQTEIKKIYIPASVYRIEEGAFMHCYGLEEIVFDPRCAVTYIGNMAFGFTMSIGDIVLPETVTEIGESIFVGSGVKNITIPSSLEYLGQGMFAYCTKLENIQFNGVIYELGYHVFEGAAIKYLDMPDGLDYVEEEAFGMSWIEEVVLPGTITSGLMSAFYGCPVLREVTFEGPIELYWGAFAECPKLKILNGFENVTFCSSDVFYMSGLEEITFHEGLKLYDGSPISYSPELRKVTFETGTVEGFDSYYFNGCTSLEEVIFEEDEIQYIDANAFQDCASLVRFEIPSNVTEIGENTFRGCKSLEEIVLSTNVVSIGEYAFEGCESLASVTYKGYAGSSTFALPEVCLSVLEGAFQNCTSLTEVNIHDGVATTGLYVFQNCTSLEKVVIESPVFILGDYIFDGCINLQTIEIPEVINTIGAYAFNNCEKLTSDGFIKQLYAIPDYAFNNCKSIMFVQLGTNCKSVGNFAFNGCTTVNSVILTDALQSIGDYAFADTDIISIAFPANVRSYGAGVLSGCTSLLEIEVNEQNIILSVNDDGALCDMEGNILYAPSTLTEGMTELSGQTLLNYMGGYALSASAVESIVIPEGTVEIPTGAFFGMRSLKSVTIPSTVTKIGDYAFANCSALEEIVIPDSVLEIGASAFENCIALTDITLSNQLKAISAYMFRGCESLATFTIPAGVETIADFGLANTHLIELTIPANVKSIGSQSFAYNMDLVTLEIEEGLETIGMLAFRGSSAIEELYVPDSATDIGHWAFAGTAMKVLSIPGIPELGNIFSSARGRLRYWSTGDWIAIEDTYYGEFAKDICYVEKIIVREGTVALVQSGAVHPDAKPTYNNPYYPINGSTFTGCVAVKEIVLPNTLKRISCAAFMGCTALETLILPDSLEALEGSCMFQGTALKKLIIPANTIVSNEAFGYLQSDVTIYCRADAYFIANCWNTTYFFDDSLWYVDLYNKWQNYCYATFVFGYTGN